ncbi:MAG: hypothetical protein DMF06_06220 [Verrucomicrobia bacterium]|nr:MAG: hypothetical protein DMF06_06220 [Verrucomicrobiota bacterium]
MFETRSRTALSRCYPRSFAFYVADPIRSIRASNFGIRISAATPQLRSKMPDVSEAVLRSAYPLAL